MIPPHSATEQARHAVEHLVHGHVSNRDDVPTVGGALQEICLIPFPHVAHIGLENLRATSA